MHIPLRVKLILAMTLIVTSATIGTALVSLGVVRKAYEDKFASDFKSEVRHFSERQLNRLDQMRKKCRELAANDTLAEAMEKKDLGKLETLTKRLKDYYEFQQNSGPGPSPQGVAPGPPGQEGRRPAPGAEGGQRPPPPNGKAGKATLLAELGSAKLAELGSGKLLKGLLITPDKPVVAVLDDSGEPIYLDAEGRQMGREDARGMFFKKPGERPRDGGSQQSRNEMREQMKQSLKKLASRVDDEQEIAYSAVQGMDNRIHLREQIVTPVLKKGTDQTLGALIVGVMTSDLGERALNSYSRDTDGDGKNDEQGISSGFWLDGILHTETIPKDARQTISDFISSHVNEAKSSSGFHDATLPLQVEGSSIPHKVLFRVLNPDSPFSPACQVAVYSLRDELEEERQLQQKILSIGLLSLAVALVFILWVSRNLTKPVKDLVKGTELIRAGNFDARVTARSSDELGQLAHSFNEMAAGLQLNQKYQRLLSQVADRMVAEQLINNEAALGGELREVSVLFCDIRGFSKLTTGMPPHDVIAMLNEHMTALTALVHQHHGVVDKFVGDMVMAIFGAPSAHGDDAARAALCALRMVEVRDRLNTTGRWQFQVGIGIATGVVVAGCMGSDERLDYTVLGERVNLASRLCGQAAPGEILIDENTFSKLGTAPNVQRLPGLTLKGFDESITAFQLTGWRSELGSQTATLTLSTSEGQTTTQLLETSS